MQVGQTFSCGSMTAALRRVLVRPPRADELGAWKAYGWRSAPDRGALVEQHEQFCTLLGSAGAEVVAADLPVAGDPDAIYAHDPLTIGPAGAILFNVGKRGRRGEAEALAPTLERAGVPIAARVEAPATIDGGDLLWLDRSTICVGRGYRTNDAGIASLRALLPDVDVLAFDLPHLGGPASVLHLLSLLSPLDDDLVVGVPPLMPVRLMELLAERGIAIVEVPESEFDSMGANVLALAPRVALALEHNVETNRRLAAAGVEVVTYAGAELSKGEGGPTCLTRPLLRA
jgi:N-dimethylarginine dimethylaminohydrolase